MQEKIDVVYKPEISIEYYLKIIIDFLVSQYPNFIEFTKSTIGFLIGLSIPVSVLLFIGIIAAVERLKSIRKKESEIYDAKVEVAYEDSAKGNPDIARRWDKVVKEIESENPNDWRQAILEADIILGELLVKMGYRGESIGEQLKRAVKSDFNTLDEAWEAHLVRNRVAHDGSDLNLSHHEARRVISLYRKVFEEFFYI